MPASEAKAALFRRTQDARAAARFLYPVDGRTCAECEREPATEHHHWDRNPFNNAPTNVVLLCAPCHDVTHRHEAAARMRVWHQKRRDQTHCKRGHPLSGPNGRVDKRGRRYCWTCRMAAQRAWRREKARVRGTVVGPRPWLWKSHCKRGHPLTVEGVYTAPDGQRRCRQCMVEHQRAVRAARAARRTK